MQNPKAKLSTINGIIRDEKIFRVRFIYAKKVKGEMCKRCDVCMKAIEMNCEWNTMLCIVEQILEEQLSTGILERFAAEKDNEKKKRYATFHTTPWYEETAKQPNWGMCTMIEPSTLNVLTHWTIDLFDTLVNFCWHKIGLTADIEKAYLMVGINETDRDMLRFLWFKDPDDLNSEIVHLRFTHLVFGLRPSPGISTSTIQHHLDSQVTEEFKPHFIELLKNPSTYTILLPAKDVKQRCWSCVGSPNHLCNREDSI